jgi:hypothetical protein
MRTILTGLLLLLSATAVAQTRSSVSDREIDKALTEMTFPIKMAQEEGLTVYLLGAKRFDDVIAYAYRVDGIPLEADVQNRDVQLYWHGYTRGWACAGKSARKLLQAGYRLSYRLSDGYNRELLKDVLTLRDCP